MAFALRSRAGIGRAHSQQDETGRVARDGEQYQRDQGAVEPAPVTRLSIEPIGKSGNQLVPPNHRVQPIVALVVGPELNGDIVVPRVFRALETTEIVSWKPQGPFDEGDHC